MTEWTPVENGLPELEQIVLVSYRSGYDGFPLIAFGARLDDGEGWLWGLSRSDGVRVDKDAGWNDAEADDDYQVTHWMPLPAPPSHNAETTAERKE